jgi:hypothetical protein
MSIPGRCIGTSRDESLSALALESADVSDRRFQQANELVIEWRPRPYTRAAYGRAIGQFLAWTERAGYQDLEDIKPITAAASPGTGVITD